MNPSFQMRRARPEDTAAAYHVCLRTGDYGKDGEPFYRDDPDALGRIFVGPYLALEPALAWVLEDALGVCGYALGALDSRAFYQRYDTEWRPRLCREFPWPGGDPATWTRAQRVHSWYHQPDYFCPEPYAQYPSHLHIDLLERARGKGWGRRMLEHVMQQLRDLGSPGAHLGVANPNTSAAAFYRRLGFHELAIVGDGPEGCTYMGKAFRLLPDSGGAR